VKQVSEDIRKMTARGPTARPVSAFRASRQAGDIKKARWSGSTAPAPAPEFTARASPTPSPRAHDKGEGTIGCLSKDETLINEVEGVVEDVGDLVGGASAACRRSSGFADRPQTSSPTSRAAVELRLQPLEDKYHLDRSWSTIRAVKRELRAGFDVDTTNPNLPPHYRTITT
jgi:phospholipid/cholesterol/gamma-HCH transport system substrate-binding protein